VLPTKPSTPQAVFDEHTIVTGADLHPPFSQPYWHVVIFLVSVESDEKHALEAHPLL
jgi:hypothetical protein